MQLDWDIFADLQFSLIGGYTYYKNEWERFAASQRITADNVLGPATLNTNDLGRYYRTLQQLLIYNKILGDHEITLLVGHTFETQLTEESTAFRQGFPNNDVTVLVGSAEGMQNSGRAEEWALDSYLARLRYSFKNKYLVEGVVRHDGSSRFRPRAVQYFYLSQHFGAVPLVTNTLTIEEANTLSKNAKSEVVQFVIDELTSTVEALPQASDLPASEFGRATKQAALGYLGRAQLGDQRFSDAAATYKQIIDFGDHSIDPDYESLFNGTNETSPEIILSVLFLPDLASNGIMQHAFPAVRGGWHIINPLGSLVESYEFVDGTPFSFDDPQYNPEDVRENRDPRLTYNVLVDGEDFGGATYVTHPDSTNSIDQLTTTRQATRTGFGIKKFMLESFSGDIRNSGIDLPLIRYAEILLSYLEAKLEAGDPIDQALLDATINQVRGRASVNMPLVTETDPDALRTILRRERRNELALEGIRYWDLIRWRTAHEVLQGNFYGASFPDAVNLRQDGEEVDPFSRWFVTEKNFREDADYQWPIPQSEVNINPNLAE